MADWTAVVPLKARAQRKSRLTGCLSSTRRGVLSERMARHVVGSLVESGICDIRILSPEPPLLKSAAWVPDVGDDLNKALNLLRAALGSHPLLVIHADLPLLCAQDVRLLIAAAESGGAAIAPDRHGRGTNAIAYHDRRQAAFHFGPDSFVRHISLQGGSLQPVRRLGLMFDLDTPEDLAIFAGGRGSPACPEWLAATVAGR